MPRAEVKLVIAIVVLGAMVHFLIRLRFPARIPAELGFEHEIRSDSRLREIAETLGELDPLVSVLRKVYGEIVEVE